MLSMLRARNAIRLITLALALLVGSPAARAEEKAGHAAGAQHRAVYEAEVHDPATGKTTTRTFDLSKPEDKATLQEAVSDGHVHELRVQEDLGLTKLFSLYAD